MQEFKVEGKLVLQGSGNYPPYPVFVDLTQARVVVVGAGDVAARKVETLLNYGAAITVIAPRACDAIEKLAKDDAIVWLDRAWEPGDTTGARYVVCATDDRKVNEAVSKEAQQVNTLVNVVDDPMLCNAIVPAVVKRGKLQIAVSTDGAAPSLARSIRQDIEKRYPEHWEAYVDLLAGVRKLIKERVPGAPAQRMPLYELLTESDLESRFANGERPDAEQVYADYVVAHRRGGVS